MLDQDAAVFDIRQAGIGGELLSFFAGNTDLRPDNGLLASLFYALQHVFYHGRSMCWPAKNVYNIYLDIRRNGRYCRVTRAAQNFFVTWIHRYDVEAGIYQVAGNRIARSRRVVRAPDNGNGFGVSENFLKCVHRRWNI